MFPTSKQSHVKSFIIFAQSVSYLFSSDIIAVISYSSETNHESARILSKKNFCQMARKGNKIS